MDEEYNPSTTSDRSTSGEERVIKTQFPVVSISAKFWLRSVESGTNEGANQATYAVR